MPDRFRTRPGQHWAPAEYEDMIYRLVRDLATRDGVSVDHMSLHYCLPPRPPVPIPAAFAVSR